jgi:hypothetical protein
VRTTLNPRGPRARRCPPTRRSPTLSAAAANANDPPAAGGRLPHRARRRATGQRGTGQQRHRHKAFRLTPHRANPPLHQTRPQLAGTARPRSSPTHLNTAARYRTRAGPPPLKSRQADCDSADLVPASVGRRGLPYLGFEWEKAAAACASGYATDEDELQPGQSLTHRWSRKSTLRASPYRNPR